MSSNRGKGKRLNENERLEIIKILSESDAPSKRSLARDYGVSEGSIRGTWDKREEILARSKMMTDASRATTFRASVARFSEVEDSLYEWIEDQRRANLPMTPSLVIAKAKKIATELAIPENEFKASWQWLQRFKARKGMLITNREKAEYSLPEYEELHKAFEDFEKKMNKITRETQELLGKDFNDLRRSFDVIQKKMKKTALKPTRSYKRKAPNKVKKREALNKRAKTIMKSSAIETVREVLDEATDKISERTTGASENFAAAMAIDPSIDSAVVLATEQTQEPTKEMTTDLAADFATEIAIELAANSTSKPDMGPLMEPVIKTPMGSVLEPLIEPMIKPATELMTELVTEPAAAVATFKENDEEQTAHV